MCGKKFGGLLWILILSFYWGCVSETKENESVNDNAAFLVDSCHCRLDSIEHAYSYGDTAKHWNRTVALPAEGTFVEESHYVTTLDTFPDGRLFANTVDEQIQHHLERSLTLYQQIDSTVSYNDLYGKSWQQQWTPAERGAIGQGSVGKVQVDELKPEQELWLLTMMWAKGAKPARGTKFLLQANDKSVVVIAGYETGPGAQQYLGGVTREVHYWLETNNNDLIKIALLENQDLPCGPITCIGGEHY